MDEDLNAAMVAAVGRSGAEQLSSHLCDIADALGNFSQRLHKRGFTKAEGREMAMDWFRAHLWTEQACEEE